MAEDDFPLVAAWLREPHVAEWWGAPLELPAVQAKYGPRVRGEVPVRMFVICLDGRPIGMIQAYRTADSPEFEQATGVENAAGIDLFIGESEALGQGYGTEAIRRFATEVVFELYPEVDLCIADPSVRNIRSQRAFEKAGFRALRTVEVPGEPDPEVVYVLVRD